MNPQTFSIKSTASDRELVFSAPARDRFTAEIRGAGVAATCDVDTFIDARGLATYLSRLAACERPWRGVERWASLEGEFALEATCSSLGQVTFAVRLRYMTGAPEAWQVQAGLECELGQLPGIAARAVSFFDVVAGA